MYIPTQPEADGVSCHVGQEAGTSIYINNDSGFMSKGRSIVPFRCYGYEPEPFTR